MIQKQSIKPEQSLKVAMRRLTDLGQSILAVVDENNRLLGVITDGDIRRALLKGCGVDDNVNEAVNRSPIVGMENDDDFNHRRIMEDSNIDRLPITKLDGKFVRFEFRTKKTIPNAIPNLDGRETEYLLRAQSKSYCYWAGG